MKKLSIVMGTIGLILLAFGSFFYKSVDNAVDSGGSTQIITFLNGDTTVKIPIFVGGVLIVIAGIFYMVYRKNDRKASTRLS